MRDLMDATLMLATRRRPCAIRADLAASGRILRSLPGREPSELKVLRLVVHHRVAVGACPDATETIRFAV